MSFETSGATEPPASAGPDAWLIPSPPVPFGGGEVFRGSDAGTVLDFWRYAMPDLRTNTTRGLLAEFLVHRAVGATARNVEWESFDVLAPGGVRIEVKTSAYLQAWGQRRLSEIRFSRLNARTWTPEGGTAPEQSYNADVYVFALHTALTHADYDPLDIGQWAFHVASRALVEATGQGSLGLASVRRLCGEPVGYERLAERIAACSPRAACPNTAGRGGAGAADWTVAAGGSAGRTDGEEARS
ncbi:hypothetical protein MHW47_20210 [Streptomyces sp. OfavH-34-F]|uniref:hypothetical protein n=1 Tax=Streptomyces sp. OfavH-34-F TaxID=2917760 RepID=UPI001EF2DCBD|nr:hypothetical protein [Streptomyces sp. OfavH-34-F]MCG7526761.1 hypothetical protein [Streptomyces sp. OfavH-34-F]